MIPPSYRDSNITESEINNFLLSWTSFATIDPKVLRESLPIYTIKEDCISNCLKLCAWDWQIDYNEGPPLFDIFFSTRSGLSNENITFKKDSDYHVIIWQVLLEGIYWRDKVLEGHTWPKYGKHLTNSWLVTLLLLIEFYLIMVSKWSFVCVCVA